MKRKNPGISLLISLGISFLALGIAISVITSVNNAVQRSADLGRSAQVFFAAESGLESAFFHHNARGQGVHFTDTSGPQTITLPASSAEVSWELEGRDDEILGILKERQKIQIPLFWDDSADPTKEPNQDGILSDDFVLTFINTDIPFGFNFGTPEDDAVLIDWAVSRKHMNDGLQTFVPISGTSETCDDTSGFICRDEFLAALDEVAISSSSVLNINGEILPGGTLNTLNEFMNDGNSSQFVLSFQPLLSFLDNSDPSDIIKIEGIHFSLVGDDNPQPPLPKSTYVVSSEVSLGNFTKTITAVVPEKTTIGAFDYVIFD